MEIPLKQIVTGITGNAVKGVTHIIYGVDENGCVWAAKGCPDPTQLDWVKVDNPYHVRGLAGEAPKDPGDNTPSWRGI